MPDGIFLAGYVRASSPAEAPRPYSGVGPGAQFEEDRLRVVRSIALGLSRATARLIVRPIARLIEVTRHP